MPTFWLKRGTTILPNMPDNQSEVFSHSSTLKMESTDGGISTQSRIKRPRASIIVGIVLLFLLAGISVAAGICYLNHMRTMNDISRWVDDGVVSPVSVTSAAVDGLGKRQQYSYGHLVPTNATSSITSTANSTSTTTVTEIAITYTASRSFFETAPGIPVTISPMKSSTGSTIDQTAITQSNYTVLPSIHSTLIPSNVTVTIHVNNTFTLSPSAPTLSPVINTLTITSTGISVAETLTSDEVLTTTQTIRHNITVSVPGNTTATDSATTSAVTLTVPGTVVPVPASPTTLATAAGVTGAPPVWATNSTGWNSTIYSSFAGPTAGNETISAAVTTTVSDSTSCTKSMGSTATSNDAITATVTQSHGSSASGLTSSVVTQLSTIVVPTTVSLNLENSTTTCTESMSPSLSYPLTSSASEMFYTTETETIAVPNTTKTLTITVVKSTSVSEPGNYSAKDITTSVMQTTSTESQKPSTTGDICVPVVTVTITATTLETVTLMSGSDQITVKNILSTMMSSLTPTSGHTVNAEVKSASDIPLVSISPNTTVIVNPHHETILTSTKTIMEGMTTASTDAISASIHASHASGGLMSHSVSDLATSTLTATANTITHDTNGNSTTISMQGSGTGTSVIYSTQTVMGNHTSTGVPIVPVSAGSKRAAKPFGGSGSSTTGGTQSSSTGSCIVMMIAILSILI